MEIPALDVYKRQELDYDLVLFDLPGTVNVPGVFQSVINVDYVFTCLLYTSNVRELDNRIRRAVLLAVSPLLTHKDLNLNATICRTCLLYTSFW